MLGALAGAAPAATPVFASATSAATAAPASSLVLARPANVGPGSVLLATVAFRVETPIAAPAGWSEVVRTTCSASGVALTQAVFVRTASASEPGGYSFSVGSSSGGAGSLLAFTGVDGVQPVVASGGGLTRNSANAIAPSITSTVPGALLVGAFSSSGRAATAAPAGMTLRGEAATGTAAPAARLLAADQALAAAGATGERRAQAASKNTCNVGQLVALRPGPSPPVSAAAPVVSGAAREGGLLQATTGSWANAPTSFAYRWERASGQAWVAIPGATASGYAATAADVGSSLRVVVTATNGGGSASAASAPTAAVLPGPPANTAPPAIAGGAREQETLTASTGTWSGAPTAFAYRWQRSADSGQSWTDVAGIAPSRVLGAADVGFALRVVVTATNAGGSASAASAPTATVQPALPGTGPPVSVSPPLLSGSAVEGATLNATTGGWSGALSYAFQWQRCDGVGICTAINWAVDPDHVLTDDDVGFTVRVLVTATNLAGSATAVSAPSAPVLPLPPVSADPPLVTGIAAQGETLTADPGRWESAAPVSYAYRWQRSSSGGATWTTVTGATATAYVLAAADVGSIVRALVTASNTGGSTAVPSAPTAVVAPPGSPRNGVTPTLYGIVQQGGRLSAEPGTWSGSPTLTYAWQRSTNGGVTWTAIGGARTFRYTLTAADVGRRVRAIVTATNAFGSATVPTGGQEIFAAAADRAILVNSTWYCNGAVDLALVKVTNTDGVFRDATRFDNCSGRIARVEIQTDGADGLKIRNSAPVAHDLAIDGGYVLCTGHADEAHQDGIQVMGGARLAFRDLVVWCGDPDEPEFGNGVNAAAFINTAGGGASVPTDVVVEHSVMGPGSANGVLVGESVRSGIRNSVACPDWTLGGPVTLSEDAVDGIDVGNEKPPGDDLRCTSFEAALAWAGG